MFRHYCPIALAVAENTLFALPPINRIVPTTNTRMTAISQAGIYSSLRGSTGSVNGRGCVPTAELTAHDVW